MGLRVQRGLLAVQERHTPFRSTISVKDRVDRKMETLRKAPISGYVWKETWSEMRHLSRSKPDLRGRRLIDDLAISKAEYVARISYRAWKGRALPDGRSWGYLRSALLVVYERLE